MKYLFGVIVLAVLLAFGYFVWPSQYERQVITIENVSRHTRIHRITGKVEVYVGDKWQELER